MAHIEVDEACGGVQRGPPFANAATLCRPLEIDGRLSVCHVEPYTGLEIPPTAHVLLGESTGSAK